MTAKEYLGQLTKLNLLINQKLQEVSDLRASAISVSSVSTFEERVLGRSIKGNAGFVNSIVKIHMLEKEADAEIDKFVDKKHKIINEIQSLSNEKHIDILFKKYVEFKRLEKVAVEMNYTYQYIVLLHGYALKEFQKKFQYKFND